MSAHHLRTTDEWIAAAITHVMDHSPSHEFLQRQLTEIRRHIAKTRGTAVVPNAPTPPPSPSVRHAIDAAVTSLREAPGRLTPAEVVILSKLLVVQSLLCTTRFKENA